ncbi:hypothetical protein [Methanosphaera sp. BMS]|nr:hypothetical protein [Methanosphaera sp. BMS]
MNSYKHRKVNQHVRMIKGCVVVAGRSNEVKKDVYRLQPICLSV